MLSLEIVKQKRSAVSQLILGLFWYILFEKIKCSCKKNSWGSLGFKRKIMKYLSKSSHKLSKLPTFYHHHKDYFSWFFKFSGYC